MKRVLVAVVVTMCFVMGLNVHVFNGRVSTNDYEGYCAGVDSKGYQIAYEGSYAVGSNVAVLYMTNPFVKNGDIIARADIFLGV